MKLNSQSIASRAAFVIALIISMPGMLAAQGTLYVSSLGTPQGQDAINDTEWIGQEIETGNNPGGYTLNSVEVQMAASTGSPAGFALSLFSVASGAPSQLLGGLSGSANPASAGAYMYNASGITLAPSTEYYFVESATSSLEQGSFEWDFVSGVPVAMDGWQNMAAAISGDQGADWSIAGRSAFQVAIYATPVPEPSPWILGALGGGILLWVRMRRTKPNGHGIF
jgi:hypothetical protein